MTVPQPPVVAGGVRVREALHWPGSVRKRFCTFPAPAPLVPLPSAKPSGGAVTVTACVAEFVLPWLSVTVQVTVVWPTGNAAGASLVTEATPQLSPVVGVPSTTPLAVHRPASVLTETGGGATIVGFWLSSTVT